MVYALEQRLGVKNASITADIRGELLAPFVGWHVPYISDEARKGFLEDYRVRLEHLSDDLPMVFPRLEQFDEELYPLK